MSEYTIPGKLLYREICGEADIFISQYGDSWIVGGTIEGSYRDRTFNPSPYPEREPYGLAIKCFDDTLNQASKIYGIPRQLPDKPDFTKTINI